MWSKGLAVKTREGQHGAGNKRCIPRLAYLTSEYPAVSHTFIRREIQALRQFGIVVATFSIRRPPSGDPRSNEDESELGSTVYLLPPKPVAYLMAHVVAAATRPLAYGRALLKAITVRPPGLRSFVWHLFYFAEAVYLWRRLRRMEVSHLHVHFAMACATVAMLASYLGDLTYSMTVHGPTVFYDRNRYLLREKVHSASGVVCISDFCRSQVMALSRPRDWAKLSVVHCGVDPSVYVPQPRSRPERSDSVRLLNVARLSPVKAHAILLNAIAQLKQEGCNVECTIVGDGPERAHLESLCSTLELQDRVTFAGSVDQDAIQRFYDRADIFVLPSFAEGVPVVLMEAMAKELPVITCRIMGIPELVDHGINGLLLSPGRCEHLAEAIAQLANDVEMRTAMGRNGRQKILREFDVGVSAGELVAIFAEFGSKPEPSLYTISGGAEVEAVGR